VILGPALEGSEVGLSTRRPRKLSVRIEVKDGVLPVAFGVVDLAESVEERSNGSGHP